MIITPTPSIIPPTNDPVSKPPPPEGLHGFSVVLSGNGTVVSLLSEVTSVVIDTGSNVSVVSVVPDVMFDDDEVNACIVVVPDVVATHNTHTKLKT